MQKVTLSLAKVFAQLNPDMNFVMIKGLYEQPEGLE